MAVNFEVREQRNGRAYVGGYLPVRDKAKLAAVAQLRGETLTQLIQAFASRVDVLAPLLPAPAGKAEGGDRHA